VKPWVPGYQSTHFNILKKTWCSLENELIFRKKKMETNQQKIYKNIEIAAY
jgi:hypothetical protein